MTQVQYVVDGNVVFKTKYPSYNRLLAGEKVHLSNFGRVEVYVVESVHELVHTGSNVSPRSQIFVVNLKKS